MIAAAFGLAITGMLTPEAVAAGLSKSCVRQSSGSPSRIAPAAQARPFRALIPDFADLILNVISLEYHETLMAASGAQARQVLDETVQKYVGKYILVVESSIPTKEKGIYMKLAGRPALDVLADIGGKAAAIVAIASCASWGGIPSADPDPTGAVGVVCQIDRWSAPADPIAMLFDNAIFTECRACMPACNDANGLPADSLISGGI